MRTILLRMDDLIKEIEAYCKAAGIAPTTFGRLSGAGGTFISRLRAGGGCTMRTVEKIRQYMADNPAPSPAPSEPETEDAA